MAFQVIQKEDTPAKVLGWVDRNRNFLLASLGVGVIFFVALAGMTAWMKSGEDGAQEALFKAQGERQALETLAGQNSKSKAGLFALMQLAQKDLDEKKFDTCSQWYEKMYAQAGRDVFFRVLALHGTALCHRADKDFQKASEIYERAALEPGHKSSWLSLYESARCLELAKAPEAKIKYQTLLGDANLPLEIRTKIEERLIWLRLPENS